MVLVATKLQMHTTKYAYFGVPVQKQNPKTKTPPNFPCCCCFSFGKHIPLQSYVFHSHLAWSQFLKSREGRKTEEKRGSTWESNGWAVFKTGWVFFSKSKTKPHMNIPTNYIFFSAFKSEAKRTAVIPSRWQIDLLLFVSNTQTPKSPSLIWVSTQHDAAEQTLGNN